MQAPFAVVQHVEQDSPAAEGGLQLGDKVIKFGDAQGPAGLTILQSRLQVLVPAICAATGAWKWRQLCPVFTSVVCTVGQIRSSLGNVLSS
jgi:26S proteasome regulatory subunit N4